MDEKLVFMKRTLNKRTTTRSNTTSSEVAYRLLKKKLSKIKRSLFILIGILSLLSFKSNKNSTTFDLFIGTISDKNSAKGPIIEEVIPELTPENVYAELERLDVKHPEIVLRQSILETGWYECEYCSLEGNNIFGFRYKKKYIQFDNWVEGVAYYKKWQDKRYKGGDYYNFLREVGYATSKTYISKLKSIKIDFL